MKAWLILTCKKYSSILTAFNILERIITEILTKKEALTIITT